jgi:hypothetical protein
MLIQGRDILQALIKRKIPQLYHANSVTTSCGYLTQGALLSRGEVERRGLIQTPQISDQKDKELGLWDCIFLDFVDILKRAKRPNKYGPVLFVFDVMKIDWARISQAMISKRNAMSWNIGDPLNDLAYADAKEFERDYQPGDFRCSLILKEPGNILL